MKNFRFSALCAIAIIFVLTSCGNNPPLPVVIFDDDTMGSGTPSQAEIDAAIATSTCKCPATAYAKDAEPLNAKILKTGKNPKDQSQGFMCELPTHYGRDTVCVWVPKDQFPDTIWIVDNVLYYSYGNQNRNPDAWFPVVDMSK